MAMLVIAASVTLSGCDPLDREELQREVQSIQSIAAEGALLANQVAADRTKATFVRVQAGELAGAADQSAEKLNDAEVEPDLEPDVNTAIDLAGRASSALGDLMVAPGDEPQGSELESQLERTAARAERLAGSL